MITIEYLKLFSRNISFLGIIRAFTDRTKIKDLQKVDILYLCLDNSRPIKRNGVLFSPLIDTVNYRLEEYKSYTLALPFSIRSGKETFGNVINLNSYILIGLFKRLLRFQSLSLKQIDKDPIVGIYEKILKKTSPKIIIGIQPSSEICIAAHRNNIEVHDLQHGIIDTKAKLSYYSKAKRRFNEARCWPDYILCRNSFSYNKVLKELDFSKPILLGNLSKYFYQKIYKEGKKKRDVFKDPTKKIILYTLQPIDVASFLNENTIEGVIFPKVLLRLIKENKYNYLIKFHPSQIQHPVLYEKHKNAFLKIFEGLDNVDFIECNKYPLDNSLSYSDLHITFNSACVFDAMDYNVISIVLDGDVSKIKSYFGELTETEFIRIDPELKTIDSTAFDKQTSLEDFKLFDDFIESIKIKLNDFTKK